MKHCADCISRTGGSEVTGRGSRATRSRRRAFKGHRHDASRGDSGRGPSEFLSDGFSGAHCFPATAPRPERATRRGAARDGGDHDHTRSSTTPSAVEIPIYRGGHRFLEMGGFWVSAKSVWETESL